MSKAIEAYRTFGRRIEALIRPATLKTRMIATKGVEPSMQIGTTTSNLHNI